MYLKIQPYSTPIAGMGPTAWNRDRRVLKMYTPHHPEYRDKPRDERVAVQGKGRVIQEVRNGI